ncbi:MAG: 4a-hydroxytetrahydrobiopterin dehydratase [Myxococcales bacterium]|jgi:4a-hydroxytetrahydrobiopterin dehydratase|nr:4a-hydroxytetrahydrobiopterin dehydratase [Myxococcales bacterium]MBL0195857.1 4a-hydroxytetrahydrobiopterin dehydratase [Myxococcales bacterium]HQY63204.1 4a-hydroxytetrahydrobiopterin dehydratase [Polyangiaceae bacterium]
MLRPPRLDAEVVSAWLATHPGWERDAGPAEGLVRAYSFADFASALAFVVRVGLFAERTDHHPELALRWGLATVRFSTHEPPGLTQLDFDGAEAADAAYRA